MRLYKRGRVYWIEWQKDNVQHRESTRMKNRKAAEAYFAAAKLAADSDVSFDYLVGLLKQIRGVVVEQKPNGTPFADAWDAYKRTASAIGQDAVRPDTMRRRRNVYNTFVKWIGKKRAEVTTVEHVTGPVAAAYAASLTADKLAVKTRKNVLGNLGTVWRTLSKAIAGLQNPWTGLSPIDTGGVRRNEFTREQERAIMAAAERVGMEWPLACLISRHTGLRYGDVAMLKWSSVDLAKRTIALEPRKTARHGVRVLIPMNDTLHAAMSATARETGQSGYVLPLHADAYDTLHAGKHALSFRKVLDAAGIKGNSYTFHSWRHTFRSRLAEAGVSVETAMRLCGHTTEEMSAHYDHADHLDELGLAVKAAEK